MASSSGTDDTLAFCDRCCKGWALTQLPADAFLRRKKNSTRQMWLRQATQGAALQYERRFPWHESFLGLPATVRLQAQESALSNRIT
jgi:hypothetical protein